MAGVKKGYFLFATVFRPALGLTHLLSVVYRGLFPQIKRPGREADHSPSSSTEVRIRGAVPLLSDIYSWRGV